jgi:hypothetical protein
MNACMIASCKVNVLGIVARAGKNFHCNENRNKKGRADKDPARVMSFKVYAIK